MRNDLRRWLIRGLLPAFLMIGSGHLGAGTVELHAHLFMKDGMSWGFKGDFDGPLYARDWQDRMSSQANHETLNASGIDILVVSLYANPLFVSDLRNSIRRQIGRARQYVAVHPEWLIATNPGEARRALADGKHVMVLALEGASGILETEQDIEEFIDQGGIRIVTFLHLSDDSFGGAALMGGFKALANPLGWVRQKSNDSRDRDQNPINPKGITRQGYKILRALLSRNVWIDLAHSSDMAQREIIPILMKAGQPLLYTHTALRRHYAVEREIADWQLDLVRQSRGIIGLVPSEELLEQGIFGLAAHYREASAMIGSESVMMGTDFNGGMQHLKPRCCTKTSFDRHGLWHMGHVPALWQALANLGAPVPQPLSRMTERFLEAWSKVFSSPAM